MSYARKLAAILAVSLTLTNVSSAFAAERLFYRIPQKTGLVVSSSTTTPAEPEVPVVPEQPVLPDITNDGQFVFASVTNSNYAGMVGDTYTSTIRVRSAGAAIAMGQYPVQLSGANILSQTQVTSAAYCYGMTKNNVTLTSSGQCFVVVQLTVPAKGKSVGYVTIGGARIALVTTGYDQSDIPDFTVEPFYLDIVAAASDYKIDRVSIKLKNTSSTTGSFTYTNYFGAYLTYTGTTCLAVAPGATCDVFFDYINGPEIYTVSDYTLTGKVANVDGTKAISKTYKFGLRKTAP